MIRGSAVILLSLLVTAAALIASPRAAGQEAPTEELAIVFLGSSAYWQIQLRNNVTLSGLTEAEASLRGVEGYALSVTRVADWRPEHELFSQVFASDLVPELVPGGAFLEVRTDSEAAAVAAAASLEPVFGLNFILAEQRAHLFRFYSHADLAQFFRGKVAAALAKIDGFARLATEDVLLGGPLANVQLRGDREGGSFAHRLTLGGLRSEAVTFERPSLSEVFSNVGSVNTSEASTGSRISVRIVGGLVVSAEGAEFSSPSANSVAQVSLALPANARIPIVNATLSTAIPSLVATREVDRGTPSMNETVEIRIRLRNLGPPGASAIENVTVREDWWQPWFDLVEGNGSSTVASIAPGQTEVVVYNLRVRVPGPAEAAQSSAQSGISYQYRVGNSTFEALAVLNQLRLVLNNPAPAVRIEAIPASTAPPLGAPENVTLNVINSGGRTAFSLRVMQDGRSVGARDSLAPGQTWSLEANTTRPVRTSLNVSLGWQVAWLQELQEQIASSNDVRLHHSPATVQLANPQPSKRVEVLNGTEATFANVTLTVTNEGEARAEDLLLQDSLPLPSSYINGSAPFVNNSVEVRHPGLAFGENASWWYLIELADAKDNYIVPPAELTYRTGSETFARLSQSAALPLGVEISQTVSAQRGFVTTEVSARVILTNQGSRPIFDVHATGGTGNLVRLRGNATSNTTLLAAGQALEASFGLELMTAGNVSLGSPIATFLFGGVVHRPAGARSMLTVYELPAVTLAPTPPEPIEDEPFRLTLTIRNPSDFELRDVRVRLLVPDGLTVMAGASEFTLPVLAPQSEALRELTVVTTDPLLLKFRAPEVTFVAENVSLAASATGLTILVGDDIPVRYGAPLALAAALGTLAIVVVRRRIFAGAMGGPNEAGSPRSAAGQVARC